MHEIKSQQDNFRKSHVVPSNVVDTKISLFTAPSASASTSGHQRVATYQQRPKNKDYNQVRGMRTNSKHQKKTQSLPASKRDPDSELNSVKGGPHSVAGRANSRRSSSANKLPSSVHSSNRKRPTASGKLE